MTSPLSKNQIKALAKEVAEIMLREMDEMKPLEWLVEEKHMSRSYVYHNADILGGVKFGGKWYFSKMNIERLLRGEMTI